MFDQNFIANQRMIIEKEIIRLEKDATQKNNYEEIGTSNEDNALEFESVEEKSALLKNTKEELEEYKSALKQIEDGKYGICKKCGRVIEDGRLRAYPAAQYCATDAAKK